MKAVPLKPFHPMRGNVREPVHNTVIIPYITTESVKDASTLYGNSGAKRFDVEISILQALELQIHLAEVIADFCKRADVRDVLMNVDPGPVNRALGLR